MRRIVSLWLPHWRTELKRRRDSAKRSEPLALIEEAAGAARLAAVCPVASDQGLAPGMTLADARALVPGLAVRAADPAGAARALDRLAGWALRFSPWTAPSGGDGLWLDVTGCGHLFGGEAALLDRLTDGVERRGFTARAAVADTPGTAWAAARFGSARVVAPGAARDVLSPLPMAALRLDAATVAGLDRLGLRRVSDLLDIPRAPLARRFGAAVARRLDQALGRAAEPISPHRPVPAHVARRVFAEPMTDDGAVRATLDSLLEELCHLLDGRQRGARRLVLTLFRVDGGQREIAVGTGRPARDPAPLARLFTERLDGVDIGLGLEAMTLSAPATDPLAPAQPGLARDDGDGPELGELTDRLANRLGGGAVMGFAPRASHIPERAVRRRAPLAPCADAWPGKPRPLRLLSPPAPIEAVAVVPDDPPSLFRWQGRAHRVTRATGPERIAGEWWRDDATTRDYYRVEDQSGARFWLYREGLYRDGAEPRWFLHGLFG